MQRNTWKPVLRKVLWLRSGNLHQSRHKSQYLSLQPKARHVGLDTPVYSMTKPQHLS